MVRALHAAGIEVILDVVYNHTAEGGPDGPMLSFRGIDNGSYYRLADDDPSRYVDYTGCGNTFDPRRPFPLQLITDSLRYWITEMHVDGFRFDLASALARSLHDVDKLSSFFDTIHQDPVISQVKLIAEPWDVGAGGYQVGEFPPLWTEWNGKYRDTVRSFWAHGDGGVRDLAYRLSGSSDLYGDDGRLPIASINFVTAHDGFTMRDLVSLRATSTTRPTARTTATAPTTTARTTAASRAIPRRPTSQTLRLRQARNLLTHAAAVDRRADARRRRRAVAHPGRQQQRLRAGQRGVLARLDATERGARTCSTLTRRLLALRRRAPGAAPARVLRGPRRSTAATAARTSPGSTRPAASWPTRDWFDTGLRSIGMYLDGRGLRHRDRRGEVIVDDSFLLLLHAGDQGVRWTLPGPPWADGYDRRARHQPPGRRARGSRVVLGGDRAADRRALGAAAARRALGLTGPSGLSANSHDFHG